MANIFHRIARFFDRNRRGEWTVVWEKSKPLVWSRRPFVPTHPFKEFLEADPDPDVFLGLGRRKGRE